MIRYATTVAGVTGENQITYVNGLPAVSLPPAEMIGRINVNTDPFSPEFGEGDAARIDIVTRSLERKFRFNVDGGSLGFGGRNTIDPNLRSQSHSGGFSVRGPVPHLPLTFSLRANAGSNEDETPIRAVVPESAKALVGAAPAAVPVSNTNGSVSLNMAWAGTESSRGHFVYQETHAGGQNTGAGGLTLPDAGFRSDFVSRSASASFSATAPGFTDRGGVSFFESDGSLNANATGLGIVVPGSFSAGGAALSSSRTSDSRWVIKDVLEPASGSWSAGVTVSRRSDTKVEAPNPAGTLEFPTVADLEQGIAGQPSGIWMFTRGNGVIHESLLSAAPYFQMRLFRSEHSLVRAGVRLGYESGFGMGVSPRVSGAIETHGFVLRAGGGLFVTDIPNDMLMRVREGDADHLRQYVVNGSGFTEVGSHPAAAPVIRTVEAGDFGRPSELLAKTSVERPFRRLMPGVEYTWVRDRHLAGSRRLPEAGGYYDLLESDRSAERHRVHVRLGTQAGPVKLTAHYEWARSYDNTSGPFSFPEDSNDLRKEWARSASVSPHTASAVANVNVRGGISVIAMDIWRSPAPFNITSGLDPSGDGLFVDRGGRPRNSGNGPSYNSLSVSAHKRFLIPERFVHLRGPLFLDVGVRGENLLGNRNYLGVGTVAGSPSFGAPVAGLAGRSVRMWVNVN
jgi:hypothetical protein